MEDNLGLDPNTTVALSYSVKALLVLSVATFLFMLVPILVAFIKLRGEMVISGANSRVISAACHPLLFANSSSISFKSPWSSGNGSGQATGSPRSPRDIRSSHRSRRPSEAGSEYFEWPLVPGRASDAPPSPYVVSPMDGNEIYRGRRSSEATVRTLRPESQGFHLPSPLRSPGARATVHRPRTMSESSRRRPSQTAEPEGQRLMPPPSPYDPRSPREPTSYFPQTFSGLTSRRPSDVSAQDNDRLIPPSPYEGPQTDAHHQRTTSDLGTSRRSSSVRPPSEWGRHKFEPSNDHDAPPEATSLEPPTAPWMDTCSDDAISPFAQSNQRTEERKKGTPLSLITPASPHRKLPWTAEVDSLSSPATPRVPSVAPQFLMKEGAMREKALRKLAGRRLRWGAMPVLDRDTSAQVFPGKGAGAGRLGFGSVESGVGSPEVGKLYG